MTMKTTPASQAPEAAPNVNVTPLIDVLLVLLIIFMVLTPLKPHRFKALIPQPPDPNPADLPPPDMLVVTIGKDLQLKLNQVTGMRSVADMSRLRTELVKVFQERKAAHAYRYSLQDISNLPEDERIERTVFIKAPRSIPYGEVVKVIDGIKGTGAQPIGLQTDELEN